MSGTCFRDKSRTKGWAGTQTAQVLPTSISDPSRFKYNTCLSVFLSSSEKYSLGHFVLAIDTRALDALPIIGRVTEILQIDKSAAAFKGMADFVLLEVFNVAGTADVYGLPLLKRQGWGLMPIAVS
jgi:hypothetical protein